MHCSHFKWIFLYGILLSLVIMQESAFSCEKSGVLGNNLMAVIRQNVLTGCSRSILIDLSRSDWNIGLKLTYISLQLIDLGLTIMAASSGYHELNPFVRGLLDSPLQLFTVKLIIPAAIAWLLPGKFLIPGIMLLSLILGWNFKELISLVF
jgi:hypothetical protein